MLLGRWTSPPCRRQGGRDRAGRQDQTGTIGPVRGPVPGCSLGCVTSLSPPIVPMDRADCLTSDGRIVTIRPARPEDSTAVLALHDRSSDETRYFRFFSVHPTLSREDAERFVTVDHVDREALVVVDRGEIVGLGGYDRCTDPASAEIAFLVDDTHQRRGIGSLLLEHLCALARAHGIQRLEASVLATNHLMLTVFAKAGFEQTQRLEYGIVDLVLDIDDARSSAAVHRASGTRRRRRRDAADPGAEPDRVHHRPARPGPCRPVAHDASRVRVRRLGPRDQPARRRHREGLGSSLPGRGARPRRPRAHHGRRGAGARGGGDLRCARGGRLRHHGPHHRSRRAARGPGHGSCRRHPARGTGLGWSGRPASGHRRARRGLSRPGRFGRSPLPVDVGRAVPDARTGPERRGRGFGGDRGREGRRERQRPPAVMVGGPGRSSGGLAARVARQPAPLRSDRSGRGSRHARGAAPHGRAPRLHARRRRADPRTARPHRCAHDGGGGGSGDDARDRRPARWAAGVGRRAGPGHRPAGGRSTAATPGSTWSISRSCRPTSRSPRVRDRPLRRAPTIRCASSPGPGTCCRPTSAPRWCPSWSRGRWITPWIGWPERSGAARATLAGPAARPSSRRVPIRSSGPPPAGRSGWSGPWRTRAGSVSTGPPASSPPTASTRPGPTSSRRWWTPGRSRRGSGTRCSSTVGKPTGPSPRAGSTPPPPSRRTGTASCGTTAPPPSRWR